MPLNSCLRTGFSPTPIPIFKFYPGNLLTGQPEPSGSGFFSLRHAIRKLARRKWLHSSLLAEQEFALTPWSMSVMAILRQQSYAAAPGKENGLRRIRMI